MLIKFSVISMLILYSNTVFSNDSTILKEIHKSSVDIENYSNNEAIQKDMFIQLRSKANITNKKLSSNEIDKKVREYISKSYAPILIKNYAQIYSEMIKENKDFSNCKNPVPIKPAKDILKALCLKEDNGNYKIQYMTNGYSQGWSVVASYLFSKAQESQKLIAIDLQLKKGIKAYVEGI